MPACARKEIVRPRAPGIYHWWSRCVRRAYLWLMQVLSEYVARRVNAKDEVSGRFRKRRFGCREVADEQGLPVRGLYVELLE